MLILAGYCQDVEWHTGNICRTSLYETNPAVGRKNSRARKKNHGIFVSVVKISYFWLRKYHESNL